jgi:hypothetical protein
VGGIDDESPPADQPRLAALPEHRREQLLKPRRAREADGPGVTKGRVIGRLLGHAIAEKPPKRHVRLRGRERRAHRRQPAPREHEPELTRTAG